MPLSRARAKSASGSRGIPVVDHFSHCGKNAAHRVYATVAHPPAYGPLQPGTGDVGLTQLPPLCAAQAAAGHVGGGLISCSPTIPWGCIFRGETCNRRCSLLISLICAWITKYRFHWKRCSIWRKVRGIAGYIFQRGVAMLEHEYIPCTSVTYLVG